jgi:tetratricopeptide (TPR) repeat protein
MESSCKNGFRFLYEMKYPEAKTQFEQMIQKDPSHPAGYIYLASSVWLEQLSKMRRLQTQIYNRGNAFFQQQNDPTDPQVEKAFYGMIEKGRIRANMRLKSNRNDLAGLYYLGTAHGAIAGYESTIKRSFFSSLQNGKKAVEAHKMLIKRYPHVADAYLSVGMYNYVVGNLPVGVKLLMLLGGVHGSKEEGLKQLEKAFRDGSLARDEAAVILVILYDRERRQEDALKLLKGLSEKYPGNPVFPFESATMLTKVGRLSESMAIYHKLLQKEAAQQYLLDFIHYEYAEVLFLTGSWQEAYNHFVRARRVMERTPVGLITMTHLRAGQCLNAMGRHKEAAVEYGFVLKQPDIRNSRDQAKKYLKNPWSQGWKIQTR